MNNSEFSKTNKCSKYFIPPPIIEAKKRIIAIGDIHGDLKLALQSLSIAGLINNIPYYDYFDDKINPEAFYPKLETIQWTGGETYVVQVGDQIDRCRPGFITDNCNTDNITIDDEASDIIILKFFYILHLKARRHGGAVISLLGNHELMNIMGKMRYVSKKGIDQFNGEMNRIKYFRRKGKFAQFLACTRYSAVIIGSFLFTHAGIIKTFYNTINRTYKNDLENSRNNIININEDVKNWVLGLIENDNINYIIQSQDSLFWNRILGSIPKNINKQNSTKYKEQCSKYLDNVLDILKIKGMIIGHTPFLEGGIAPTCNNKLFRIDIGASKAFELFKNNQQNKINVEILEILNDDINKPIFNICTTDKYCVKYE